MKKLISCKTKLFIFVLLGLLNFIAIVLGNSVEPNFQPVHPNQFTAILTMISNETKNNYNKIKIWQGEVDTTTGKIYKGTEAKRVLENKMEGVEQISEKVKRIGGSTVEFAVNFEEGLFFDKNFYMHPLIYMDLDSGELLSAKSIDNTVITVATHEHQIKSRPFLKQEGVIIARKAVKEKVVLEESRHKQNIFDPRIGAIDGKCFRESFLFLINYIEKHGEFRVGDQSLRIEKCVDKATTEYRIVIPSPQEIPGKFIFTTMIFNSNKGFNITSSETLRPDGKLFQKAIWEYEAINDVYLPTRHMIQTFGGESAELDNERECIYTNLKLNQTLPEDIFTYKNLGLKDGDKFIDKIQNKEFTYQNEKLVEVIKEQPEE